MVSRNKESLALDLYYNDNNLIPHFPTFDTVSYCVKPHRLHLNWPDSCFLFPLHLPTTNITTLLSIRTALPSNMIITGLINLASLFSRVFGSSCSLLDKGTMFLQAILLPLLWCDSYLDPDLHVIVKLLTYLIEYYAVIMFYRDFFRSAVKFWKDFRSGYKVKGGRQNDKLKTPLIKFKPKTRRVRQIKRGRPTRDGRANLTSIRPQPREGRTSHSHSQPDLSTHTRRMSGTMSNLRHRKIKAI